MSSYKITNRIGHIYSFPMRIGGFVIAGMGLVMLLALGWNIFFGIVFMLIGLYFATASTGIVVDVQTKSVLHYSYVLGFRRGRWKEYPTYKFISVVRKDLKRKKFFQAQHANAEATYRFEVYLVSRSMRGKVLLEICYDREEADFRATRYAQDMNISVAEYNPPTRTKKRKRSSQREE